MQAVLRRVSFLGSDADAAFAGTRTISVSIVDGMGKRSLSAADRSRVSQNFLSSIRSSTLADVTQARQRLRYDFLRKSVDEQAEIREQMFKLFDRLQKAK